MRSPVDVDTEQGHAESRRLPAGPTSPRCDAFAAALLHELQHVFASQSAASSPCRLRPPQHLGSPAEAVGVEPTPSVFAKPAIELPAGVVRIPPSRCPTVENQIPLTDCVVGIPDCSADP